MNLHKRTVEAMIMRRPHFYCTNRKKDIVGYLCEEVNVL